MNYVKIAVWLFIICFVGLLVITFHYIKIRSKKSDEEFYRKLPKEERNRFVNNILR